MLTSKQVKSLRNRMNLTQEELAKELGCSKRKVEYHETGAREMTLIYVWALYGLWAKKYSRIAKK